VQLKRLAPFLVAFVLPLILIYAWWGGLNPVDIGPAMRGPYTYAYLDQIGDYAKLPDKQGEARKALLGQKLTPGLSINVLYSNPDVVPKGERRARAGYLVPEGAAVAPPLKLDTIPARQVVVARVKAGVLLAPSRAYAALDDYLQKQGKGIVMPTVEIYEPAQSGFGMGILTVEMNTR
jgi:hypothetical protein